jgi:cytochrome c6
MKKILAFVLVAVMTVLFSFNSPALAGDAAAGANIFSANCAACHMGGKNIVNPAKTLSKEDLAKYGKDSIEAITTQVINGAGAMPGFGSKFSAQELEDVATYILAQSEKGW